MMNWWQHGVGLFHHPTLPNAKDVYTNFKGKVFNIPVIHVRKKTVSIFPKYLVPQNHGI